jgi:acyl-coenzyme A synthetase/AMP-(fatty) acid ligase
VDKIALIGAREGGTKLEQVTYDELIETVSQLTNAMKNARINKEDRVAAIISNSIRSFVILLAAISTRAIFHLLPLVFSSIDSLTSGYG